MVRIIPLLLLVGLIFSVAACAPGSQPAKEVALLGDWSTVKNYDATEIAFSLGSDGTRQFNSFLRGRPYESGTWQIKGADISIFANGNNTYTFKAFQVENDTLTFSENRNAAVFSRILESDPAREELISLLPAFNKFLNVTFPAPAKTTFDWLAESGGPAVKVAGYETAATVTVNGDFSRVNQAGTILYQNGFSADKYNVTEILDGYRKENLVCQIVLGSDPNNNDCYFTLRCGALP